jgi:hypothetical protein
MPTRTFQLIYPKKVDSHRKVTEKMIDEIIENDAGDFRYPVAIGHDAAMGWGMSGDAGAAAGRFNNLRKDDNGMLLGDVTLQPETDEAFSNGEYPGWSVGIYNVIEDREAEEPEDNLGWHMDHLALLGSVGAAFKDLQEVTGGNFSILNQSAHGMEIECFNADRTNKKTMWLLQCVPMQPATVETPAALSSAPDIGVKEMDPKEFEAYKAEQEEKLATLQADNAKLKADNEARLKAETDRRTAEFTGVKTTLLKATADKGVTEPARTALSTALDAYDAHYASGIVSKELFDALTDVFGQLKSKLEPGELPEHNDEADEFVQKQTFNSGEAMDALTN